MRAVSVELRQLSGEYFIARLAPTAVIPIELLETPPTGTFVSITRTPQELSIVCPAGLIPSDAEIDGPWAAWYAGGPIPFGLTGIVTSLVAPLSTAGCPVFVVSTFDGDILMVPMPNRDQAGELLAAAGHSLT
jgi:uncharacterized protein